MKEAVLHSKEGLSLKLIKLGLVKTFEFSSYGLYKQVKVDFLNENVL